MKFPHHPALDYKLDCIHPLVSLVDEPPHSRLHVRIPYAPPEVLVVGVTTSFLLCQRHAPGLRPLLGPEQIGTIVKSQLKKRKGKRAGSFTTVLEQGCDESPSPMELPTLAHSERTSSFKVLQIRQCYDWEQPMPGNFTSGDSPYSVPETEDTLPIHESQNLASPSQRMTRIRMITEDLHNQKGADDDVIGALQLTFNKEELK